VAADAAAGVAGVARGRDRARQGGGDRPLRRGKTTFVGAVAEPGHVATETAVSDRTASLKTGTTVSLDFGALDVPDPDGAGHVRVALFEPNVNLVLLDRLARKLVADLEAA